MPRLTTAAVALVTALCLAGCGSTLTAGSNGSDASGLGGQSLGPTGQSGTGSSGNDLGTTGNGDTSTTSGAAGSSGSTITGANTGSTDSGSDDSSSVSDGTSSQTTGTTTSAPTSKSRGVTASTITLGVIESDSSGLANSLGISGGATISQAAAVTAEANYINAHGGILGRHLVIAADQVNSAEYVSNPDEVIQEVCTYFGEDHPVFAIFTTTATDNLLTCAAKMGSPLIDPSNIGLLDASQYAANNGEYLYGPATMPNDRMAQLFIESLDARNFFEKWNATTGTAGGISPTKLGAIYPETEADLYGFESKDLAQYGLSFSQTATYAANLTAGEAATDSAVLKFKAEGVTEVFGASTFFLEAAQSEGYHPRYAYDPGLGELGVENAPAAQLNGAMTIGWQPTLDVNAAQSPPAPAAATQCQHIMNQAGVADSGQQNLAIAYGICDGLTFLQAALNGGGTATVAGLHQGVDRLGSSWQSALALTAQFTSDEDWSENVVRDMAYSTSCACLEYSSNTNRS